MIDAKGKKAKSAKGGGGGFGAKPTAQASDFKKKQFLKTMHTHREIHLSHPSSHTWREREIHLTPLFSYSRPV